MLVKRPFTDDYLLDYSKEHLFYEIQMFFALVEKLSHGNSVDGVTQNALIESFVIHLRNLIDFLDSDPKGTDVVAADFIDDDWTTLRGVLKPDLDRARTRANKEIAHLTTSRIAGGPKEKQWEFVTLSDEIRPLLNIFINNAAPTRLATKVSSLKI